MSEPTTTAAELRSWARNHAALRAGRGNVDDVLAFADWIEAVARQQDGSAIEADRAALAALPPSAPESK